MRANDDEQTKPNFSNEPETFFNLHTIYVDIHSVCIRNDFAAFVCLSNGINREKSTAKMN